MDADDQGHTVTAGLLGKELGLTSGATTFCIARLEKANLAMRESDDIDRRKVIISLSARGRELGLELFRPVSALRNNVMDQFNISELHIIERFLSATTEAMAQYRQSYCDSVRSPDRKF